MITWFHCFGLWRGTHYGRESVLEQNCPLILVWQERELGGEAGGMLGLQLVTNSTAHSLWGPL